MTESQIIWTFISNFLSTQNLYPDVTAIKNAYPNNVPLTVDSNFVVITRLGVDSGSLPTRQFSPENQQTTIGNQDDIAYQVDCYGVTAQVAASSLQNYLLSTNGSNDLLPNGYGIGKVDNVQQMTHTIDRDNYIPRFVIRFTALCFNSITVAQQGIGYDDISVVLEPNLN